MYCKNCGALLPDGSKFCTSCGSKIEVVQESVQDEYQDYFDEPVQEKEQDDFNYNQGLQEGTTYTDRPSNVYGKKFTTGASGNIKFSESIKKQGFVKKLIVTGAVVAIVLIAYFALFGDGGPVYDVELGVEIDDSTYYPSEPLTSFIASEGLLYISYSTREMFVGDSMTVEVYDVTFSDTLVDSINVAIDYEEQVGYVFIDNNWTVGDYEVRFEYEGEVVYTTSFEVFNE